MRSKVAPVLLVVFIFLSLGREAGAAQSLLLSTEDGQKISAACYPAPSPDSPGVILIPDTRCDGSAFGKFPSRLNKAGFGVLVMDLRYKDLIARAGRREEQITLLQSQDVYAPVNYELKSALEFLAKQKEINPGRICLIGASYGARVAIHSGVKYNVKALVLFSLSGQEALPGKAVKELLEEYGPKPILFMTSEKDWGGNFKAAEHNRLYFDWAKGKKELKIWPGSYHGVDLLDIKGSTELIIAWLKENL